MKTIVHIFVLLIVLHLECFSQVKTKSVGLPHQNIVDMHSKFEFWKSNEIKMGHIRSNCDGFDYQVFLKKSEEGIEGYTRFGLDKIRYNVSYGDFNNDKIIDGLFKIYFDDCAQGNGYVGGPEDTYLLVLSSNNGYVADNFYLNKINFYIKSIKRNVTRDNRGYINNLSISNGRIIGDVTLWKAEECDGCSSIGGFFILDKMVKEISFNLKNKTNNSSFYDKIFKIN